MSSDANDPTLIANSRRRMISAAAAIASVNAAPINSRTPGPKKPASMLYRTIRRPPIASAIPPIQIVHRVAKAFSTSAPERAGIGSRRSGVATGGSDSAMTAGSGGGRELCRMSSAVRAAAAKAGSSAPRTCGRPSVSDALGCVRSSTGNSGGSACDAASSGIVVSPAFPC